VILMRTTVVIIALLVFGLVRLPMERAVSCQHEAAYFRSANLGIGMREQVGQLGFLAALSGFRSVVADMLWIEAHTAWQNTEWGRMALLLKNVTTLQPRVAMFWDTAAWHMAWNASVSAYNDPDQPREVLRRKAQREYFDLGRDFLERGIKNIPDRYILYDRMANLLRIKYEDHCLAAEYYQKAATFADAPAYTKRFAAYELSYCEGKEAEAYAELSRLYHEFPDQRKPTLLSRLAALQQQLDIPEEQRIYFSRE